MVEHHYQARLEVMELLLEKDGVGIHSKKIVVVLTALQ